MACFQMLPDQGIHSQAFSSDFIGETLSPETSIAEVSALFSSKIVGTRGVVNSSLHSVRDKVHGKRSAQSVDRVMDWSKGVVDDRRSRPAFKHNCAEGGSKDGVSGGTLPPTPLDTSSTSSQQLPSLLISAGSRLVDEQPEDHHLSAELLAYATEFGLPKSKGVLCKIQTQPHVEDGTTIPDYFGENDEIDDAKLPPYLKGLKVKVSDITITREQFNLFIYEAFVLVKGRDELISLTNEPGFVQGFEVEAKLKPCEPWQGRLRQMNPKDKPAFAEVLERYLRQGLIEESTSQPAASAMLVERKEEGTNLLVGFSISTKTRYPIPIRFDY